MSIVTGLDIGSAIIKCIIAEETDQGFRAIGAGEEYSEGIVSGQITNIEEATTAITSAISRAEKSAGEQIDKLIVSVNRSRSNNKQYDHEIKLNHEVITEKDIQRLMMEAKANILPTQGREILHVTPVSFSIDDHLETSNPLGLHAQRLHVKLNSVTTDLSPLKNIDTVLHRCQLSAKRKVFAPYAAGLSVLKPDESEMGAIVIDIGAETIGISAFIKKSLIYTNSLPFGLNVVRNDIALGLGTTREVAEKLMHRYGNAILAHQDSNSFVTYNQAGDDENTPPQQQSVARINKMINERLKEIFEQITKKIASAGIVETNIWHIIFTGGGANLEGLPFAAHEYFKGTVRIGLPQGVLGSQQSLKLPQGACVTGLLQFSKQDSFESRFGNPQLLNKSNNSGNRLVNIVSWFKQNF